MNNISNHVMMPRPERSIRRPLVRKKCCGPISNKTTFMICEKCKHRPCCQMNYVCNCCLAKHKLKLCCSFEKMQCVHRTQSEVILPTHEDEVQKEIQEEEKSDGGNERGLTDEIFKDVAHAQVQTISEENNSRVNEFEWNEKNLYTPKFERNSKLIETYDNRVIKPPPKVWNISEGKSTVPNICYKTEWYLENTKEFSPENSCECELCMKERKENSSMNAFKNCFSCCKKEKTVYTRYRKVPAPDFSESEDDSISQRLKRIK